MGIWIAPGVTNLRITGGNISNITGDGLRTEGQVDISKMTVSNTTGHGFALASDSGAVLTDSLTERNGGDGVHVFERERPQPESPAKDYPKSRPGGKYTPGFRLPGSANDQD
jgi:hypothetical protein